MYQNASQGNCLGVYMLYVALGACVHVVLELLGIHSTSESHPSESSCTAFACLALASMRVFNTVYIPSITCS